MRVRWKDFRGAAELVVPERRDGFGNAREAKRDTRDLSITDYQLEDARLSPDGTRATVVSRISWTRLPSVSENSDLVTSEFVFRDGSWLLARQDAGPFAGELSGDLPEKNPRARSQ